MKDQFENRIRDFILENSLLAAGDRLLLAVSGGADSMALLHAINQINNSCKLGLNIRCMHINHQIRGLESDTDESFVRDRCGNMGITTDVIRVNVQNYAAEEKISLETAGRRIRIKYAFEIALRNNISKILTAHHKNDNAETVIQRLCRGTGIRGLGGIWPRRVFKSRFEFIRPLLSVTKKDIFNYLHSNNLKWCTDRTNQDCLYRRNYIRNKLLPLLQQDCSESITEQLDQLSYAARGLYRSIHNTAESVLKETAVFEPGTITIPACALLEADRATAVEMIRQALTSIKCGESDISSNIYTGVLRLVKGKKSGKQLQLPRNYLARYEYGKLQLCCAEAGFHKTQASKNGDDCRILNIPGTTLFDNCSIETALLDAADIDLDNIKSRKTPATEYFDLDTLQMPLKVRRTVRGDKFIPLGHNSEKKIGKFITSEKTPAHIRQKIMIIEEAGHIIWVRPLRISQCCRLRASTRRILRIRFVEKK